MSDSDTKTTNERVVFPLSDEEYKQRCEELNELVTKASNALDDATKFADKYHLTFHWDLAYGMGGSYYGDPAVREDEDEGWYSSSSSC